MAGRGKVEALKILLADHRVDPKNDVSSALRYAADAGHVEVVRLLLEDGRCDPSTMGSEALYLAAVNKHLEIVELLMRDGRVCVDEVIERIERERRRLWIAAPSKQTLDDAIGLLRANKSKCVVC